MDDEEAPLVACGRPLPPAVRVSTIKMTVARAHEVLDGEGVAYEPTDRYPGILEFEDGSPGTNWPYFYGWLHSQEGVLVLPAIALDP